MECAVGHVDTHDPTRAASQETVGEAARGSANIEHIESGDVDSERRQSVLQLVAATRHESENLIDSQFSSGRDRPARVPDGLPVDPNATGQDCGQEPFAVVSRLLSEPLDERYVPSAGHRRGD